MTIGLGRIVSKQRISVHCCVFALLSELRTKFCYCCFVVVVFFLAFLCGPRQGTVTITECVPQIQHNSVAILSLFYAAAVVQVPAIVFS